jgi:hypothetical protein
VYEELLDALLRRSRPISELKFSFLSRAYDLSSSGSGEKLSLFAQLSICVTYIEHPFHGSIRATPANGSLNVSTHMGIHYDRQIAFCNRIHLNENEAPFAALKRRSATL